jgi:hypothetical protein
MTQLGLFDEATRLDESRMGKAFRKFHGENPGVYYELRKLAIDLHGRGRERYGIAGLFEVLRWQRAMTIVGDEAFKLNNNYRAFYARMLMHNDPALAGFFATRESEADDGL